MTWRAISHVPQNSTFPTPMELSWIVLIDIGMAQFTAHVKERNMFWFSKRRKKVQTSVKASRKRSRFLRFEGLECRAVLAAGVVDVQIFPFIAAGTLNLEGDGSNNEV